MSESEKESDDVFNKMDDKQDMNDENNLNTLNVKTDADHIQLKDVTDQNIEVVNDDEIHLEHRAISKNKKSSFKKPFIDSDSEGENSRHSNDDVESENIFVGDSETACVISHTNIEENDEKIQFKKSKRFLLDSESEDESSTNVDKCETSPNSKVEASLIEANTFQVSSLAGLCDTDSSDDDCSSREIEVEEREIIKQKHQKSNKSIIKENVPKKMTGKEALKQRQEIVSESQRMLRESRVSLPYHKPKEHSLQEFLKNRPRLSILKANEGLPTSAAMKMTTEELQVITKKMREREKELQKFYESESESESEEQENNINEVLNRDNEEEVSSLTINNVFESDVTNNNSKMSLSEINEIVEASKIEILDDQPKPEHDLTAENNIYEINSRDDMLKNVDNETVEAEKLGTVTLGDEQTLEESPECFQKLTKLDHFESTSVLPEQPRPEEKKIMIHSIVIIPKPTVPITVEDVDYDLKVTDIPHIEVEENKSTLSSLKKDLLEKKIGYHIPCLSGDSDQEIDLLEEVVRPNAIMQLKERFKKHIETKPLPKDKIQLNILNFTQGEIHNETVVVPMDVKEQPINIENKPALRLQKLRIELQERIAQHKADVWKHKNINLEDNRNSEESSCNTELEENILDDDDEEEEEEEELTNDEISEDSDIEMDEVETKNIKSDFIFEEAEEDEDDYEEVVASVAVDENIERSCDGELVTVHDSSSNTNLSVECGLKYPLRRILKGFTEDSDDEDIATYKMDFLKEDKINNSLDDDAPIPPNPPRLDKTPHRELSQCKTDLICRTPITPLTTLQDLISDSKFLQESPQSPLSLPQPTPVTNISAVKQKLFADSCDVSEPEETNNVEETYLSDNKCQVNLLTNTQPLTQDLLDICSGSFSSLTNDKCENSMQVLSKCEETLSETENSEMCDTTNGFTANLNGKYLDEDRLISQLLVDEEELQRFKKKFESPVTSTKLILDATNSDVRGGGRLIFDSDDEDAESSARILKMTHKRLDFSDEESDVEVEKVDDSDLDDEYDDISLQDDKESNAQRNVDYDSEENEIEVPRESYKLGEFFEKEAELTESEWDSADEDEKDLDILEEEQGDKEVFDNNQIKSTLAKIHIQNILDQDNRDIKMLQELLLEDGELHGTGRQRQFRWRNIDANANDDGGPTDGDPEVYLDEEESELEWRKSRHQREMFLKSQQEKQNTDDEIDVPLDTNSQVLKIGQEALRRTLSNTTTRSDKEKTTLSSEMTVKPNMFLNTRGSFLARSENFLTRLADITKVNTSVNIKTSKKIVFQTCDNSKNKRKTDDGTPVAIKKLRLSSNISPSLKGLERKKKLF